MAEETKIVEAVGTAATKSGVNARDLEKVMNDAVQECFDNGITDPEEIIAAKRDAYRKLIGKQTQ